MRYDDAVVVGVDEGDQDRFVLDWAAGEAAARQTRLVVCHVWEWSDRRDDLPEQIELPAGGRAAGPERLVGDAVRTIGERFPGVPVSGALGYGSPARTLVEVSDGAAMVVVGSRGAGGFADLLVGSVSAQVAAHARSPVAVVRRPARADATDVVVGLDGSAHSERTLRAAVAEARRFGGALVAVHGYRLPPPAEYGPNAGVDEPHRRVAAEDVLDRVLAGLDDELGDIKLERRAVHGGAAAALLEAAADAAVLVVGARGGGGFTGLVLGSVSQQVVRHAPGPVVVAH